jgi:peptide/nickel transport system permease protein
MIVLQEIKEWLMEVIGLLKRRPWGIAGAVILLAVVLVAALTPVAAPHFYNEMSMSSRLQPPGGGYILGTDNLGRDIFSRLLYGSRPYVEAGLIAAGTALVLGLVLGLIFRKAGNKAEKTLRIVLFTLSAIAGIVVLANTVIFLLRFLPLRMHLINIMISAARAIDMELIMGQFAVFTGLLLSLIFLPAAYFVARRAFAAESPGKGLVSLLAPVPVYLGIAIGAALLVVAPMSYYGFGVPPPTPEWGSMLSSTGRQYLLQAPWMWQAPVIAAAVTVLGLVLFAPATWELWLPRFSERQAASE